MEEKQLIKGLKRNKEEAYDELINLYGNKLLRTCFLINKDEKEAEDIVQETFIKVFRSIRNFKGTSSLYTWIYRILQNTIKDRYKNKILTTPYEDYEASEYNMENIVIDKENRRILKDELDKINFIYKQVLVLFYFDDLSIKEISEVLDEKEGTVKSKLSRGRKMLAENLIKGGEINGL